MGDFEKGNYHGKGRIVWFNGDWYEGTFENGYLHGKGRCRMRGKEGICKYQRSELKEFTRSKPNSYMQRTG